MQDLTQNSKDTHTQKLAKGPYSQATHYKERKRCAFDSNKGFVFKVIRGDDADFWSSFVEGITISQQKNEEPESRKWVTRPQLRSGKRKKFSWRIKGDQIEAYEIKDNAPTETYTPLFDVENNNKYTYSKPQSTSYADPSQRYFPPPFGHNRDRKQCLVGISVPASEALISRIMNYDGGTVNRDYEFNNHEHATRFIRVSTKRGKIFATLDQLVKASEENEQKEINELHARIKWIRGGASYITIFTDNLSSRLLAQVRQRDLQRRLRAQDKEDSVTPEDSESDYQLDIRFYPSGELYSEDDKAKDIDTALRNRGSYRKSLAKFCSIDDEINRLKATYKKDKKDKKAQEIEALLTSNHKAFIRGDLIRIVSCLSYDTKYLYFKYIDKKSILKDLLDKREYHKIFYFFNWVPSSKRGDIVKVIEESVNFNEIDKKWLYSFYIWALLTGKSDNPEADVESATELLKEKPKLNKFVLRLHYSLWQYFTLFIRKYVPRDDAIKEKIAQPELSLILARAFLEDDTLLAYLLYHVPDTALGIVDTFYKDEWLRRCLVHTLLNTSAGWVNFIQLAASAPQHLNLLFECIEGQGFFCYYKLKEAFICSSSNLLEAIVHHENAENVEEGFKWLINHATSKVILRKLIAEAFCNQHPNPKIYLLHAFIEYTPDYIPMLLSWVKHDDLGQIGIREGLCAKNRNGVTGLELLVGKAPNLVAEMLLCVPIDLYLSSLAPLTALSRGKYSEGKNIFHLLASTKDAQAVKAFLNKIYIDDFFDNGFLAKALIEIDGAGNSALAAIAEHTPEALEVFIEDVAKSKQGRINLAKALFYQNERGESGLQLIARNNPAVLDKLFKFVTRHSLSKIYLAQALVAEDRKGENGLQTLCKAKTPAYVIKKAVYAAGEANPVFIKKYTFKEGVESYCIMRQRSSEVEAPRDKRIDKHERIDGHPLAQKKFIMGDGHVLLSKALLAKSSDAVPESDRTEGAVPKAHATVLDTLAVKRPEVLQTTLGVALQAKPCQLDAEVGQALKAKDKAGKSTNLFESEQYATYDPYALDVTLKTFIQQPLPACEKKQTGLQKLAKYAPKVLPDVLDRVEKLDDGQQAVAAALIQEDQDKKPALATLVESAPSAVGQALTMAARCVTQEEEGKSVKEQIHEIFERNGGQLLFKLEALLNKGLVWQRTDVNTLAGFFADDAKAEIKHKTKKTKAAKQAIRDMILARSRSSDKAIREEANNAMQACLNSKGDEGLQSIFLYRRHRFFNKTDLSFSEAKSLRELCARYPDKGVFSLCQLVSLLEYGQACLGHAARQKVLFQKIKEAAKNNDSLQDFKDQLETIFNKQKEHADNATAENGHSHPSLQSVLFTFAKETAFNRKVSGQAAAYDELMTLLLSKLKDDTEYPVLHEFLRKDGEDVLSFKAETAPAA